MFRKRSPVERSPNRSGTPEEEDESEPIDDYASFKELAGIDAYDTHKRKGEGRSPPRPDSEKENTSHESNEMSNWDSLNRQLQFSAEMIEKQGDTNDSMGKFQRKNRLEQESIREIR